MRTLAALAAAIGLMLGLGACGEVLDATSTEEQLESSIEREGLREGVADRIGVDVDEGVASVECPTDQEIEAGAVFGCQVTFENGVVATETVRIVNEDADLEALGLSPNK